MSVLRQHSGSAIAFYLEYSFRCRLVQTFFRIPRTRSRREEYLNMSPRCILPIFGMKRAHANAKIALTLLLTVLLNGFPGRAQPAPPATTPVTDQMLANPDP